MSRRIRRVSRWIDDLLHDRGPRGFRRAEEGAKVLAAAIELRSASPGAGLPDPQFVESLQQRLARDTQGEVPRASRVSRRTLLASGGLAAVGAAAGLVVGERLTVPSTAQRELLPNGAAWTAVATLADVPDGTARSFDTGSVRGFLVNRGGEIAALSGVCTHLGCLLQLNAQARRLDCPCHNAAFALDGNVLFKHMPDALAPLPRMESRIRDGQIEVLTV
ncbi:MAG TPA: Rieske (2Fe-2S) protein [Dehalococcoidia bacterium]